MYRDDSKKIKNKKFVQLYGKEFEKLELNFFFIKCPNLTQERRKNVTRTVIMKEMEKC